MAGYKQKNCDPSQYLGITLSIKKTMYAFLHLQEFLFAQHLE